MLIWNVVVGIVESVLGGLDLFVWKIIKVFKQIYLSYENIVYFVISCISICYCL